MHDLSERHRRWVANHFVEKVEELHHHLVAIVGACDQSFRLFSSRQQVPSENRKIVVFGFSAFTNVIQTLKDVTKTVTGKQLSWSQIEQLRHGAFMRHARNAATHDGHPVISAWVDGYYFVGAKIVRLDDQGHLIEVVALREDIRTLCLEFSEDFFQLLRGALLGINEATRLQGPLFSMSELEEAVKESQVIPEFAKRLFNSHRQEISTQLVADNRDPVALAIARIDETVCCIKSMSNQKVCFP